MVCENLWRLFGYNDHQVSMTSNDFGCRVTLDTRLKHVKIADMEHLLDMEGDVERIHHVVGQPHYVFVMLTSGQQVHFRSHPDGIEIDVWDGLECIDNAWYLTSDVLDDSL